MSAMEAKSAEPLMWSRLLRHILDLGQDVHFFPFLFLFFGGGGLFPQQVCLVSAGLWLLQSPLFAWDKTNTHGLSHVHALTHKYTRKERKNM